MKKLILAASAALTLAGCNDGPDEASMKGAIEEALGNHFAAQMQQAMLQGNLNRAMEGLNAASMSVDGVKRKSCEKGDPGFFCDIDVPMTVKGKKITLYGNVHFWNVEKKLLANVQDILKANER